MILYMSFRKTSVYSEQSLSKSQRKYKKIEMIIEKIYPLEIVRLTKNTMNRVHYMRKKNACLRRIQRSHARVDHRLRTSESGTSHYNVLSSLFSSKWDLGSWTTSTATESCRWARVTQILISKVI